VALEVGTEDGGLGEATFATDMADLEVGGGEEHGGFFESELHFELGEGAAEEVLDEAGEVTSGTLGEMGEFGCGEGADAIVGEGIEGMAESGFGEGSGGVEGFVAEEDTEEHEGAAALGEAMGGSGGV
jgi:hypothetical protein